MKNDSVDENINQKEIIKKTLHEFADDAFAALILTKDGNIVASLGDSCTVTFAPKHAALVVNAVTQILDQGKAREKADEFVTYEEFIEFVRYRLNDMSDEIKDLNAKVKGKDE